jgi:hypothetical protein
LRFPVLRAISGALLILFVAAPAIPTDAGSVSRPYAMNGAFGPQTQPQFSFVGGGEYNGVSGSGTYGTAVAGYGNNVTAQAASILGGYGSTASAAYAAIGGGFGNVASGQYSVISGGADNNVKVAGSANGEYASIGGGYQNLAEGEYSALAGGDGNTTDGLGSSNVGGYFNTVNSAWSFVGGGYVNTITTGSGGAKGAMYAAIVGGLDNTVKPVATGGAANAFIGGGDGNTVEGTDSSIVGGNLNVAIGQYATIPGGSGNYASGTASFAAGTKSAAQNSGTFVWSDDASGATTLGSTAANQFLARASGGFFLYSSATLVSGVKLAPGSGSWSTLSDRSAKTAVADIDGGRILAKLAALPVSEWSYIAQGSGVRHLGPMAQDFHAAFGLGEDDRHISTVDEEGVALAAIKALASQVAAKDRELNALRRMNDGVKRTDAAKFAALGARIDGLARSVQTIEAAKHPGSGS